MNVKQIGETGKLVKMMTRRKVGNGQIWNTWNKDIGDDG